MATLVGWLGNGSQGVNAVDLNGEYMARLGPIIDRFSDEELERLSQGTGPRLYVLLDDDGLPKSGVIYDPDTGRREKVRFPIRREVA